MTLAHADSQWRGNYDAEDSVKWPTHYLSSVTMTTEIFCVTPAAAYLLVHKPRRSTIRSLGEPEMLWEH